MRDACGMLHLNLGRVLVRILTPLNVGKGVEKTCGNKHNLNLCAFPFGICVEEEKGGREGLGGGSGPPPGASMKIH